MVFSGTRFCVLYQSCELIGSRMVVTGITNVYHKVPHDEPEDEEKNSYMDQGNTSDRQHVLPVVVDSSDGGGKSSSSTWQKVGSAVFYGFSSVLIVFVNKILLTNFRFEFYFKKFVWSERFESSFLYTYLIFCFSKTMIEFPNYASF